MGHSMTVELWVTFRWLEFGGTAALGHPAGNTPCWPGCLRALSLRSWPISDVGRRSCECRVAFPRGPSHGRKRVAPCRGGSPNSGSQGWQSSVPNTGLTAVLPGLSWVDDLYARNKGRKAAFRSVCSLTVFIYRSI
jgi:hypothetical protein